MKAKKTHGPITAKQLSEALMVDYHCRASLVCPECDDKKEYGLLRCWPCQKKFANAKCFPEETQHEFDEWPWTEEDRREQTIGEITFTRRGLNKYGAKCPVCNAHMLSYNHPVYKFCPNGHF